MFKWGLGIGDWGLGIGPNPHELTMFFTHSIKFILRNKNLM